MAYVAQDVAMTATETVFEAVTLAALLRLPQSLPRVEKVDRAKVMIATLKLESCASTMVGDNLVPGCSGGERKRCAVAVELVTNPRLVFLDEDTSGLDSYAAYVAVRLLADELCAKRGLAVCCTIHQPSSEIFAFFHSVCFLRRGAVAYGGPVAGVADLFKQAGGFHRPPKSSVADFVLFVMQTCSDDEADSLVAASTRRQNDLLKEVPPPSSTAAHTAASPPLPALSTIHTTDGALAKDAGDGPLVIVVGPSVLLLRRRRPSSFAEQVGLLTVREWHCVRRDPMRLTGTLVANSFLSLLGVIFYRAGARSNGKVEAVATHFGLLFMIIINAAMSIAQPEILTFPKDRAVLLREVAVGTYSLPAYITSKLAIEVPSNVLVVFTSVVIIWALGALRANVVLLSLIITLMAAATASTTLLLSAFARSADTATRFAALVIVPELMFAGFFIMARQIPVFMRWCQWLCSIKYGTNLAVILKFGDSHTRACDDLFDSNQIQRRHWRLYLAVLAAIFLTFRSLTLAALHVQARSYS